MREGKEEKKKKEKGRSCTTISVLSSGLQRSVDVTSREWLSFK